MDSFNIFLFDAYGTLFRIDAQSEGINNILGASKSAFLNIWRSKLLEYSWLTTLMDEWIPFNKIVEKALLYSCNYYQIDSKLIIPILMDVYQNPVLFEDAYSVLVELKKKRKTCCIMSNGEPNTLNGAIQSNQLTSIIDHVFSASEVEKYKVSRQVYRMATAHFNTGPSNIYFVSSNPWDISGAQNFGYKTIWVNRGSIVFDTLIEGPDYEISNLKEIENLI